MHVIHQYQYKVDRKNCLVEVNRDWLAFAQSNDAPSLTREAVLGRSLYDFIADDESRRVYEAIIEKVRHTGGPTVIPFRCDSPDRRRFMEVTISREPGDHVAFDSRLLREERRPTVELLDAGRPTSDYELAICGWCKRIGIDDAWLEAEDAMRQLDLFGWAVLPRLAHKVCDTCNVMLQREIDAIS